MVRAGVVKHPSEWAFSDAMKLIGYGFKNFSTRTVVEEGEIVGKVKVPNGDPPEVGLSAAEA